MASGNPALRAGTFNNLIGSGTDKMTLAGSIQKAFLLTLCLLLSGSWVWSLYTAGQPDMASLWTWVGCLLGFVMALVTIFKKDWAPITAPVYALLEGMALGGISAAYDAKYHHIVLNAVLLTISVLGVMLMLYQSRVLRATENFKIGVFAATGGICLLYIADLIMSLFGHPIAVLYSSGPVGIGISLFICGIAALNLVIDFDFIEQGAAQGAPKYMEWYSAFGLMVTLVWLYLEILRLLSKTSRR